MYYHNGTIVRKQVIFVKSSNSSSVMPAVHMDKIESEEIIHVQNHGWLTVYTKTMYVLTHNMKLIYFAALKNCPVIFPVNMINLFIIGEWTNLSAFGINWGHTSGWLLGIVSRKYFLCIYSNPACLLQCKHRHNSDF